jgi:fucose 4-O-acetylase-like acetyltransferase
LESLLSGGSQAGTAECQAFGHCAYPVGYSGLTGLSDDLNYVRHLLWNHAMKIRKVTPDWLKGLAIVLMVYGHINHVGSFAILQKQVVEIIYTFHMPIFLIISGFFFKITKQKEYESGKRLAQRLVLPYLIFISLYLIFLTLIQKVGVSTSNIPPKSFFDFIKIVFLHPRGAYWFIHSLILIQLCFIFASMVASRAKLDEPVSIGISIFLLAMVCNYNLLAPRTALYFLLGMIFSRFGNMLPASLKTGSLLMVMILVFAREEVFNFSFIQVAWCLCILTLLAGIGRTIESNSVVSIFAWFGRNSLIVLVLHAMFVVLFKPSSKLLLKLDQTGLAYSVIVVVATMLGSILVAFLLDKTRISKYLFGVNAIYSDLAEPLKKYQITD